ncbi:MAG: M48 family metallopeptidase [Chloroflexota bacterium]
MTDLSFTIQDTHGKEVNVTIRRDKRLKKSSRWEILPDDSILLRIPYRMPKRYIGGLLDQIAAQLKKRDKLAERRTDADLQLRAEHINNKYFGGKITWRAIRWVNNMEHRLGSCSQGSTTDGHIRISDKIKSWPQYVVDYIIAHELVHRLHHNHSEDFWATLTKGYPLTERARGFIRGIGFAQGQVYEDD